MHIDGYQQQKAGPFEWLPEIPSHWEAIRARWIFDEIDERSATGAEELISVSHISGVRKRKGQNINMFLAASYVGYKLCSPGDLVINIMWAWMGALGVAMDRGIVSNAYGVYRLRNQNHDLGYLNYLLRTKNYVAEYTKKSTGIHSSRLRLYTDKFYQIPIITPPFHEQETIARFLDYKVGKIDRFIRKKKQLIKLLNEQKAAIINAAVTKGLDPSEPMKDSGIAWLGEIPAHWEVRKLKTITTIISKGTTPNTIGRNLIEQGPVRFLKAENIGFNNLVQAEPENYIDDETNELLKRSQLQKQDLLFVIAGATLGKIAIMPESMIPANTNQAVSFIRMANPNQARFVWYWLQSEHIKQTIWLEAVQSAQPNLAMGKLSNFPVLMPPALEQELIVKYLDNEFDLLNTTITTIQKEIRLTEEYRTALIAEAVTGKIDVRGYVVRDEGLEASEEGYFEGEDEMSDEGEFDAEMAEND